MKETEPSKRPKMPTEKLIEYEQYFAEQLPNFSVNAQD